MIPAIFYAGPARRGDRPSSAGLDKKLARQVPMRATDANE
jgi:hypothetical protein